MVTFDMGLKFFCCCCSFFFFFFFFFYFLIDLIDLLVLNETVPLLIFKKNDWFWLGNIFVTYLREWLVSIKDRIFGTY